MKESINHRLDLGHTYDSILALSDLLGVKIDMKSNQNTVKQSIPGIQDKWYE